jgi:hypothetical protein
MLDQKWMTHLPALFSALLTTTGPVLEIGAGSGSTPMLRAFCEAAERRFVSIESNAEWAAKCGSFHDRNYAELPVLVENQWGVVFVDHAPEEDRVRVANLFRDSAEIVIIHDWSSADTNAHGSVGGFHHKQVDERFFPTTISLSNRRPIA